MNVFVVLWWWAGPGWRGVRGDIKKAYQNLISPVRRWAKSLWENESSAQTSQTVAQSQNPSIAMEDLPRLSNMNDPTATSSSPVPPITSGDGIENAPGDHGIDGPRGGNCAEDNVGGVFREKVQSMFQQWSDIQAVTGIALLLAAIIQGNCLSLYHTAIVLDLINIAADGQAIMLLYAHKKADANAEVSATWIERALTLRLISSLLFMVLYFYFAVKAYERYRAADECFLSSKPRTGNYGSWGIATATLVFMVYVYAFCPPNFRLHFLESITNLLNSIQATIHPAGSDRPTALEGESKSRKMAKKYLYPVVHCARIVIAWIISKVAAFIEWAHERELSFLLGTLIYFLWNMIDIILLKLTNKVLLIGGGDEEHNFGAFGQIVPIVMVAALVFPIYDTLQG